MIIIKNNKIIRQISENPSSSLTMSCNVEEPSYLGVLPRGSLPTTSFDHADLVSPMGVLDLSDCEDDTLANVDMDRDVITHASSGDASAFLESADSGHATPIESSRVENLRKRPEVEGGLKDNSGLMSTPSAIPEDRSSTTLGIPVSKSAPIPDPNSIVLQREKRPASPAGKKKAGGRTVASRYMTEGSKTSKGLTVPTGKQNTSRSTPTKLRPTTRNITPRVTPSPANAKPPSRNTTPKPSPSRQPAALCTGSTNTTPTSSLKNSGLSDHDVYLASLILGRTAKILHVELEEKREHYLKGVTSVLVAASVAICQLLGKNNENLHRLFRVQCEHKTSTYAVNAMETSVSSARIVDAVKKMNDLEEALRIKGHELGGSDSVILPMSDDGTAQATLAAQISHRLRTQMMIFNDLDVAIPNEVRMETKKIADSLGVFEEKGGVTFEQMSCACRELVKSLNLFVDYVFKMRSQL